MKKSRISISGNFAYPTGDAAALRVEVLKDILEKEGYVVEIDSWVSDRKNSQISKLKGIAQKCSMRTSSLNIIYNPSSLEWLVTAISSRKKTKLCLDLTEWYKYEDMIGGKFGLRAVDCMLRMNVLFKHSRNIIVISKYLEEYYSVNNTYYLPPIIKKKRIERVSDKTDLVRFVYIGSPGKKDLLYVMLTAFSQLKKGNYSYKFDVIGCSKEEAELLSGQKIQDDESICFHGRLPHEEAVSFYRKSDFSIFLRKNERYAQAGFPTKFVESIVQGVPVICNISSDLGEYMVDGYSGLVVKEVCSKELAKVLYKAIHLNKEKRIFMSNYCVDSLSKEFGVEKYQPSFSNYIKGIIGK